MRISKTHKLSMIEYKKHTTTVKIIRRTMSSSEETFRKIKDIVKGTSLDNVAEEFCKDSIDYLSKKGKPELIQELKRIVSTPTQKELEDQGIFLNNREIETRYTLRPFNINEDIYNVGPWNEIQVDEMELKRIQKTKQVQFSKLTSEETKSSFKFKIQNLVDPLTENIPFFTRLDYNQEEVETLKEGNKEKFKKEFLNFLTTPRKKIDAKRN